MRATDYSYGTALSYILRKENRKCLQTEQKYLSDPVKAGRTCKFFAANYMPKWRS